MNNQKIEITVPAEYHLERIDKFLVYAIEENFSRSYIQKLFKNGMITVNGNPARQNHKVKTDEAITIEIPEPEPLDMTPENIPLDILFQDEYIAVINKQPGLVVHPGAGNWKGTLVNALLYHIKDLSGIGGTERPGIVHRLDKDTAGIMLIAKNDIAHKSLVEQFASRTIIKKYKAVVTGKPNREHEILSMPLARHKKYTHKMTVTEGGKEAVTEYTIEKIWNTSAGLFSMLDIRIHTGRTHQIRVHLSASALPIVGDPIYSKKWDRYNVPHLLLCSSSIEFRHPLSGETMKFSAPLPRHMKEFIEKIEKLVKL